MKLIFHRAAALLAGAVFSALPLQAAPREWTDQTGRKITAEYVSSEGDQVTLRMNGKEFKLPISKLSADDQAHLKTLASAPQETPAADAGDPPVSPLDPKPGRFQRIEITKRAFPNWEGYYSGRFGKKLQRFYEKSKGIVDDAEKDTMTTPETAVMWDTEKSPEAGVTNLYVPFGYDANETYGLLVFVSPGDGALGPADGWDKVLVEKKLIYCSPKGTSNQQADMRRIALALDAAATVRASFKIDPNRLFVTGYAGGGGIATMIGVNFAEYKAISGCRASMPGTPTSFPYLDPADFNAVAKQKKRFAWISGPGDNGYNFIKKSVDAWSGAGVEAKLFEEPSQQYGPPNEEMLRQALTWIEDVPGK